MPPKLHSNGIGFALALRRASLGAASFAAVACPCSASLAAPPVQREGHDFAVPVAEAALRFGIPEAWIWRVMHAESRGNRRAVSHAGAMGLMQIMPATWAMLTAKHRLGSDPFDTRANVLAGAAYLRLMWDRYRDVRLMLAAYNAGPGRVDAYVAGRRGLPSETLSYVTAIAPELRAKRVSLAAPRAADAPSWRDASLFTARDVPSRRANEEAALPAPQQSELALSVEAAASNPLFVPFSGKDR